MKLINLLSILTLGTISTVTAAERNPLSYASKPAGTYVPSKTPNTTTLLDFIKSRSDLTTLAEAFDTVPTWDFTFFAPSNAAFEKHTGQYFNTFLPTPKGKWWLGNLVQHHYVPNSQLLTSVFNETATRIQTGSYLYVGTQVKDGQVWLNDVAAVTEGDLRVTNGVVHIIDRVLDPSAQLFEADKPKVGQKFIAGSCSDTSLPYC
ncbi:hypothetical protein HER10_EVM0002163 [Colletotrichum scovillei]|uniref:uncharacterized protein n=1 Tax=Colletotrichum scovillei TaxID=1209932 RepID=UPI0015C4005C|nr:uncharacterized protein HER10_EVM0002163 [Colletotrichum scovillei]KAF4779242.1 hypothetical protein HER10_EVM0002163 [Colletotrichum scovillei]